MARVIMFFVLFLTAVLFAASSLIADEFCNLELVDVWKCPVLSSGSIWSSGLATKDGYLYFPGRDHIYILNTTDSGYISLNSTQLNPENPWIGDIKVRGDLAFVSHSIKLSIYDVSDPLVFDSLGSISFNYTNQIFLLDTLLIAAANGIHVLNISDSSNPTYVKGFGLPWNKAYLPVVDQENYPYILVPCMLEIEPFPLDNWDAFINVIDITQSYTYSPRLNDWTPDSYTGRIRSLAKIGNYYIGCTDNPDLTFFEMDSVFGYSLSKKSYDIDEIDLNPQFISSFNDSIAYVSTQDQFCLLNISDTSAIDVIAKFTNTDSPVEYYYDIAFQDSFLYVFVQKLIDLRNDTMLVYSFKLDLDFSIQCSFNDKPDKLELETYPNPFNGNCNIKYSMIDNHSPVNLEIYNINGQRIDRFDNLPASQTISWNASKHPTGIYLIRVSNFTESIDRKIVYIG